MDNSAAMTSLIQIYGHGIKSACEQYDTALNTIRGELVEGKASWVSAINNWQDHVTNQLHDAGCAISPTDSNLLDMLRSMSFVSMQKKRMAQASTAKATYRNKLVDIQKDWGIQRAELKTKMNRIEKLMRLKYNKASDLIQGNNKQYSEATKLLLGSTDSARHYMRQIKTDMTASATKFEVLAQRLKRDSLRHSVLNQIENEEERVQVFGYGVDRAAYDVLVTCLSNYQKEYDAR